MSEYLQQQDRPPDLSWFLTEEAVVALRDRAGLMVRCEADSKTRAAVMKFCKEGTPDGQPGYLYFLRNFAWILEERNPPGFQKLPFVPYPYQIEELEVIHQAVQGGAGILAKKNVVLWLKSRDMGMTWLVLSYYVWDWLFNQGIFLVGGAKEDDVDKRQESGTLFAKIRYLVKNLPPWMLPGDLTDKHMLLSYGGEENPATISGDSTRPNFGRSKRKKSILLDEFQTWEHDYASMKSISQTTNCIFLLGTPNGYGNLYAQIARGKAKMEAVVRTVHWIKHPLKTRDLETINGRPTSSWYRKECKAMEEEAIASELDLSFETSVKGIVFGGCYGIGHQKTGLKPWPDVPVLRCWDPGGIFAVIWLQVNKYRKVRVLKEFVDKDAKIHQVADSVLAFSEHLERIAGSDLIFKDCGDPSGAQDNNSAQEDPEYTVLAKEPYFWDVDSDFFVHIPSKLRVRTRIVAIQNVLKGYVSSNVPSEDGPQFEIDIDECPFLHEAFLGGYRRKLDQSKNVLDKIDDTKRPYTDVMDALGFGVVHELGIPELIKREMKKKSEEEKEDSDDPEDVWEKLAARGRTRC